MNILKNKNFNINTFKVAYTFCPFHFCEVGSDKTITSSSKKEIYNHHIICFITRGKGKITIGETSFNIKEGNIIIIPAYSEFYYEVNLKNSMDVSWISFLDADLKLTDEILTKYVIRNVDIKYYKSYIQALLNLDKSQKCINHTVENIFCKILTHLLNDRIFNNRFIRTYKIKAFIDHNFHKAITIKDIADYFDINKNHLTKTFKHVFQKTPKEYLNELRYKNSFHLLVNTNLDIKIIAQFCGFKSRNSFRKSFKNRFGISPSSFRK